MALALHKLNNPFEIYFLSIDPIISELIQDSVSMYKEEPFCKEILKHVSFLEAQPISSISPSTLPQHDFDTVYLDLTFRKNTGTTGSFMETNINALRTYYGSTQSDAIASLAQRLMESMKSSRFILKQAKDKLISIPETTIVASYKDTSTQYDVIVPKAL